jgi:hypothetical protein
VRIGVQPPWIALQWLDFEPQRLDFKTPLRWFA